MSIGHHFANAAGAILVASAIPTAAQSSIGSSDANAYEATPVDLAKDVVLALYPSEKARSDAAQEFEKSFRASFFSNPRNVAMNKRYPGLLNAMLAAGRAEMQTILVEEVQPQLVSILARELATKLSLGDLKKLLQFYESPAGQALGRIDPTSIDPKTGLVPIHTLKLEHRTAIGKFQSSSVGRRSGAIMQSLTLQMRPMANEIMRPHGPRIRASVQTAARQFTSK